VPVPGAILRALMASGSAPKRPGTRQPTQPATWRSTPPSSAKGDLATELQATRQELREALEQQTAVSEVLAAIGRAGFDPQPVFDLAITHAGRLSGANGAGLWFRDDGVFRIRAGWSDDENRYGAWMEFSRQHPASLTGPGVTGRVYRAGTAVQIPDVTLDPDHPEEQLQYLPSF
jgi:hypothetical protein